MHRAMNAGFIGFSNQWRGKLVVDPHEWAKYGQGFQNDGLSGWNIATANRVGDQQIVVFDAKKNLVVDSGVHRSLDRLFGIGGPPAAVATMGVDDGTANPVAATDDSTSGSTNRRLVAFDATPTRASKTVSADGTFTNSTVSFTMKRLFLSAAAAGTTDSAGDLVAMTNVFTMDLSGFSTWSQTFTTEYTGAGS